MQVYRIVQTGDNAFVVEELDYHRYLKWPWSKPVYTEIWERARLNYGRMAPSVPAFKSAEAAQKWIDDKRKYPIVVKQPA